MTIYLRFAPRPDGPGDEPETFTLSMTGLVVSDQDHWRGRPMRCEGFSARVDARTVELRFADFVTAPARALGMYAITGDLDGAMRTWITPVTDAEVVDDEYDAEDAEDAEDADDGPPPPQR